MLFVVHLARGRACTKQIRGYMSKLSQVMIEDRTETSSNDNASMSKCDNEVETSYWMPDARTGIYVPKGHEGVIEDVPENAASFEYTYWLRNIDGVDHPRPDYYF